MPAFITNLKNRATTQQNNIQFNSLCVVYGRPFAATEDGIFELCGGDDNGDDINASFETPIIDLGSNRDKRLRFVYLSFECGGRLTLSVSVDEGEYREYTVIPKKTGKQRIRIPIGRDGHGERWQFKLENIDGSFFAIDAMQALTVERSHGVV